MFGTPLGRSGRTVMTAHKPITGLVPPPVPEDGPPGSERRVDTATEADAVDSGPSRARINAAFQTKHLSRVT